MTGVADRVTRVAADLIDSAAAEGVSVTHAAARYSGPGPFGAIWC